MKCKALQFGLGVLAGIVGVEVIKSAPAKKLAVNVVAQGILAKESIDKTIEEIRAEAADVVSEAKAQNRAKADVMNLEDPTPCGCDA